jgi:hypothetical protein
MSLVYTDRPEGLSLLPVIARSDSDEAIVMPEYDLAIAAPSARNDNFKYQILISNF